MNDFLKGFSVGIVLLILYILLQPPQNENGRYELYGNDDLLLDTKTGQLMGTIGEFPNKKWFRDVKPKLEEK